MRTEIQELRREVARLKSVIEERDIYIASLMAEQQLPCRICEVAQSTGDDGLCNGCRQARMTERRATQTLDW